MKMKRKLVYLLYNLTTFTRVIPFTDTSRYGRIAFKKINKNIYFSFAMEHHISMCKYNKNFKCPRKK